MIPKFVEPTASEIALMNANEIRAKYWELHQHHVTETTFLVEKLEKAAPIVVLAKTIGKHWRDQEGVNGALIDELAELTT